MLLYDICLMINLMVMTLELKYCIDPESSVWWVVFVSIAMFPAMCMQKSYKIVIFIEEGSFYVLGLLNPSWLRIYFVRIVNLFEIRGVKKLKLLSNIFPTNISNSPTLKRNVINCWKHYTHSTERTKNRLGARAL